MEKMLHAYTRFHLADVSGKPLGELARWHAQYAEELLSAVAPPEAESLIPTSLNINAAAVHAQLATAYATMEHTHAWERESESLL